MGTLGTWVRRLAKPVTSWDERRTRRIVTEVSSSELASLHEALGAWMDRSIESEQYLGRVFGGIRERGEEHTETLRTLLTELRATRDELAFLDGDVQRVTGGLQPHVRGDDVSLDRLDGTTADYLNLATGYRGLAAQAGVFINEPISFHYGPGSVTLGSVNERIAEIPFVFRELHRVARGSRIVDVGSSESDVALGLASLGYRVTAVDPRGYAFPHPNIEPFVGSLQSLDTAPGSFDAAVLLSTIEHVGIEHYGGIEDDQADFDLMARLRELVRPGGLLLLTTPFGKARDEGFQRVYDDDRLRKLLDGWTIEHVEVVERRSTTEWAMTSLQIEPIEDDESRVVFVAATRPASS